MSVFGFVGLGNMGRPMAENLIKAGHEVRGFDVVAEIRDAAAAAGITIVGSANEAAHGADVLVTMLPKGEHVRAVLLAQDGPFAQLKPGGLVLDCSSIDVVTSRDVHAAATEAGLLVLDAPVSGGVSGATAGTLTFMVGGSDAALEAAGPALDAMGSKIFHVGGAGAGQAVKACNQMVVGAALAATAEAFVLAERLGLTPQSLFDVLSTSSGNTWVLHNFTPRPGLVEGSAADNGYKAKFAAALLNKDLGLALSAADSAGVELVVGSSAKAQFDKLVEHDGSLDSSAVVKVVDVKN
ncbi:3-hydroxyisobutyrate dehydrogenase [Amycolatopsis sp. La24]|uniref:3-hydroxyisobutyrate dehydrogenase n=1 Tax=Amycolatopsis sp. La24 TaxID=3028304 RepID=UPI0023AF6C59|nr:3-hydroxyisobutyrate dehydrogenase [Amycolatopsis sp. La24]